MSKERPGGDPSRWEHLLDDEARVRERATPDIRVRRVYEPASAEDGQRVLVDRLWPRGLAKVRASLDAWLKDVAPSDALRRWYGHDPARWNEFAARYRSELAEPERKAAVEDLLRRSQEGRLTLLCAARDPALSNAAVLREALEEKLVKS